MSGQFTEALVFFTFEDPFSLRCKNKKFSLDNGNGPESYIIKQVKRGKTVVEKQNGIDENLHGSIYRGQRQLWKEQPIYYVALVTHYDEFSLEELEHVSIASNQIVEEGLNKYKYIFRI